MTVLISWFIALLAVSCYGRENAEIEVLLSRDCLKYIGGVSLDYLTVNLKNFNIPGTSAVYNIKIDMFRKPSLDIELTDGNEMTVTLSGAVLKLYADWYYEIPLSSYFYGFGPSGTLVASFGANIIVSFIIGSQNGRPTIYTKKCDVIIKDLEIHNENTIFQTIYDYILYFFGGDMGKRVKEKICGTTQNFINTNLANQLKSVPINIAVNEYLTLSYSFPKPPDFNWNYIKSYHKGTFEGDNVIYQTPLMNTPSDKMIGISISENFFNSAFRVLFTKGVVKHTHTFDWNRLTKSIKYLQNYVEWSIEDNLRAIPFVRNSINGSFKVNVNAFRAPTINISSGSFAIYFWGESDVVYEPSGQAAGRILYVAFEVAANATAHISSNVLKGRVIDVTPQVQLISPPFQSLSEEMLNDDLRELFTVFIPKINEMISNGVELPIVKGFVIEDSRMVLKDRYLSVSANIRYSGYRPH